MNKQTKRTPSLPSKADILAFIGKRPGKVGTREIARAFGLKNAMRAELKQLLREMASDGAVEKRRKKLHHPGTLPSTVLADVTAAVFPAIYLGLPLGTFVALHALAGREAVLLLLTTIVVSDSAQYFTGRLFGRTKLSPAISPKKTVEGAVGGFVLAPIAMAALAPWWLPGRTTGWALLVGLAVVGLGIAGDLFESLLKRSAGVKDSSALIPGHGGVLDRIDAMLFAAPVFYVLLKYGA